MRTSWESGQALDAPSSSGRRKPGAVLAPLESQHGLRGEGASIRRSSESERGAARATATTGLTARCPRGHLLQTTLPTMGSPLLPGGAWDALQSGRLTQLPCATCGVDIVLEPGLELLDPTRRLFVVVEPPSRQKDWSALEGGVPERLKAALRRHGIPPEAPFLTRLVFGLAALRQKLALWDAGLDDALIEVVRLQAMQSQGTAAGGAGRVVPELLAVDLQRSRLSLVLGRMADGQPRQLHLPLQQYEILISRRSSLEQQLPALFRLPYVDVRRYLSRS